jgi:hypothetical protein
VEQRSERVCGHMVASCACRNTATTAAGEEQTIWLVRYRGLGQRGTTLLLPRNTASLVMSYETQVLYVDMPLRFRVKLLDILGLPRYRYFNRYRVSLPEISQVVSRICVLKFPLHGIQFPMSFTARKAQLNWRRKYRSEMFCLRVP